MIIGSLLQSTAYRRSHLIVARVVAGFGLGVVNSTSPVLQSEYSPKTNRGLCESQDSKCVQLESYTEERSRLHAAVNSQFWYRARLLD